MTSEESELTPEAMDCPREGLKIDDRIKRTPHYLYGAVVQPG